MASMMMFTDCSSSSMAARLPPLSPRSFFHFHPSMPFHLSLTNPTFPRTIITFHRPSPSSSVITAAMTTEAFAKVIDGKSVAKEIRDEITAEISRMKDSIGIVPGLAVILVGDRKDSATYVRNKKKASESVGVNSYEVFLPENSTEEEVLNYISNFNDDPSVHGILIQLPLPSHMNEQNILNAVCIEKDVDGFHPLNIGRLAMRGREPLFVPCTPKGCIELLHRYGVNIKGKRAVVIGRSNIVGMPAALLLQREDATVSVVHSRTKKPEEITKQADIIIAAVGQPNMVRGSWIKPGAVIIDVGINPVELVYYAAAMTTEAFAKVIDGKSVAKEIRDEITAEISRMKDSIGIVPGLAVILVGDRKDSATYVRNKKKASESVGVNSYEVFLPENSTEEEVLNYISNFNDDPSVHGILIQLPLPSHMNEQNILNAVCIEKDVDGFHPLNIGRLAMRGREPLFVPCTPKGCIELLHRYGVNIKGKRAVVIGRSNIVGMPAALLLQREDATVSVVHSRTKKPEEITKQADIIIAAVGQPNMVRGSWIKPGAVIIDVGINPVEDAKSPRGYKLVGDVCYEEASKIASAITPVPGGVGPMTIAMLLLNTLISAKRAHNFQ
ncbi:unnamed protein product [Ilex paraguariensis]|uniref:Methenyltetrahydrofolate cyclohydrolase n=1 Tax=Ilex paraguariensis TaxID=185542 RepID=A0ABC8UGF2_9AQUA